MCQGRRALGEELEPEEIQDETMTGLAATVTAGDLAQAQQGTAPTTVTTTTATEPAGTDEPDSLGDLLADLEYRTEAWIDGDGDVRRLVLGLGDPRDQIAEATDNPSLDDGPRMGIVLTLDLFDDGDGSIQVDLPDAADTEDITAELRDLLESGSG